MQLDQILSYLMEVYQPHTIIAYGSFATDSYLPGSDFDVVVLTDHSSSGSDMTVIGGVPLDAQIYGTRDWAENYTPAEFVPLYGGKILLDEQGLGKQILHDVKKYVLHHSKRTDEEKALIRIKTRKLYQRAQKADTEGMYRLHQLLSESLSLYCSLHDLSYIGPRQAMLWMEKHHPEDLILFDRALRDMAAMEDWMELLLNG